MIQKILEKKWMLGTVYAQMLFVVVAFALMVVSSYIIASDIKRNQLLQEAKNALSHTEAEIAANLLEPETLLAGISETIRNMVIHGESADRVHEYIKYINKYVQGNDTRLTGVIGFYGVFDVYDGRFMIGSDEWDLPEDFVPQSRPWYTTAVEADGRIGITQPYIDVYSLESAVTFTRRIFTDDHSPLGIICLDMRLDRVSRITLNMQFSEGGYGVLLNRHQEVIAHPDSAKIGLMLRETGSAIAQFAGELEQGKDIYEREAKNYNGINSIVFFRQINYGWYLGVVIPKDDYYRSLTGMALLIGILGLLLAAALDFILLRIATAKKRSEVESKQKSSFLATMSHEIRTPMNAILGITEIQLQNGTLSEDTKEAFAKIYNSGDLLLGIINDILDFSKIEAGKLELLPEKYKIASLVNDVVQLNMVRFETKPIEFKLKVNEHIPAILVGDELRIKQILNNLLSNAYKYTDSGEVSLMVDAEVVSRGGIVLVTLIFIVSDTGQGMTLSQVHRLFDEYSRFNMKANRMTEGAGLGMSITQKLIELMHGKINVESAVGKGTTVTVRLPQRTSGIGISSVIGKELAENLQQFRMSIVSQMEKMLISHEPMPYGKVLIVDDVETNLYVARGLMLPYGLSIDIAKSGFEAIDKIKSGNVYDIVFMDHMMPKMDGIEAVKNIRGMGYKHTIVALTANALMGRAEMFLANGFDSFISKPIDIRELNTALIKFIRDKQPYEVIQEARRQNAEQKQQAIGQPNPSVDTQLAGIFIRDAEKAIAALEAIYEKRNDYGGDDIQSYIINVHAMKSALANIGEGEISAFAYKLEQAGREENTSLMTDKTPMFLDQLRAVINRIKPEEKEVDEITAEDKTYLCEKLSVFQTACEAYDKRTAKDTLAELNQKNWPHQEKELLNTIAEHLLHSDFDEAASAAKNYNNNVDFSI
jgi:signal transduction histidine kinase/DNA-binding response OmpR family regulator